MSEWIKGNSNLIMGILSLFLIILGFAMEIQSTYVTQERFYHYNGEQDTTSKRLMDELGLLTNVVSNNQAAIASNTAKIDMIIKYQ